MRKIQLLTLGYFLFFVLFTSALFAQSNFKLEGTFEGLRKQYDPNHVYFMQEFQYQFDLQQNGDRVSGTSTIFSPNGDYAVVKLRGMVVGEKFYFEEYEIVDEIKASFSVWCYKTGELNIVKRDNKLVLEGETKSFTSNFGSPCTGGYTEIYKIDETKNEKMGSIDSKLTSFEMNVYPNPTAGEASITYQLNEAAQVSVEIYDLSGKLITSLVNEKLAIGNYINTFNLARENNGLYIAKLQVDGKTYSKQIVKVD